MPAQRPAHRPKPPALPQDADLAAAMKMAGDPDLDFAAAKSLAEEQREQAHQTVADSLGFLSRAGIAQIDSRAAVEEVVGEVAGRMAPPIPLETEPDVAALLGRILLERGITKPEDAIALTQGIQAASGVYRLNAEDEVVELSRLEEEARRQRVAAKAAQALVKPSGKAGAIYAQLQVDKRHWEEIVVTAANGYKMKLNGVEIGLPRGRVRVPPIVAHHHRYFQEKQAEEQGTIEFEQKRADITDEVLKKHRNFKELVITEYYVKV